MKLFRLVLGLLVCIICATASAQHFTELNASQVLEGLSNFESVGAHRHIFSAQNKEEEEVDASANKIIMVLIGDVILLSFAALFAGLTLAVMGLDTLSLEIIASSGSEPDRTYAARILPLRRKGNKLLCTLLCGTVVVNTLIAQLTDSVLKGWMATLLSTALITVGGEIVPQALMSADALYYGSKSAPILKFFTILFWPISKPTSMFLDVVIGSDPGQIYSRNELKRLMMKHVAHSHESGVDRSDLELMVGAIGLKEKTVMDVLTPISEVFMLESNRRVKEELLQLIAEKGHSRIPVYSGNKNNVVGVLHTKDLLLANPDDGTRIGDLVTFYQRKFHIVPAESKLYSMLRYFQTGASHIAIVQEVQQPSTANADPFYAIKGIVTMEDVMEELLQREILDEYDVEAEEGTVAEGPASITSGDYRLRMISLKKASRTQRRIHLSANQITACALFLQRSIKEFASADPQVLAAAIAQHTIVYKIRPPADAAGFVWTDPGNVMLYWPTTSSYSAQEAAAGAQCATVMTLIISGRAEVSPSLKNEYRSSQGSEPMVDANVSAELLAWSLINVNGMQNGNGAAVDYYCRVTHESLILQMSHTQYKGLLAALAKAKPTSVPVSS